MGEIPREPAGSFRSSRSPARSPGPGGRRRSLRRDRSESLGL